MQTPTLFATPAALQNKRGFTDARVAEKELHRSRWRAYKWMKRFTESGLEGLKNLPRAGRPPQVSEQKSAEIKRELSENLAGWRAKEVMNIIYCQLC